MSVNAICDAIRTISGGYDRNERDNKVYRASSGGERYTIDYDRSFKAEGWMQYDTEQDAAYFGVWVNKQLLRTLTFCEGDLILVECLNADSFNAEIENMNEFYPQTVDSASVRAYGADGSSTFYYQDRSEFTITPEDVLG